MNRTRINRVIAEVRRRVPPRTLKAPASEWERKAEAGRRNLAALRKRLDVREAVIEQLEELLADERTLAAAERLERELLLLERDQHMRTLLRHAIREAEEHTAIYAARVARRNGHLGVAAPPRRKP